MSILIENTVHNVSVSEAVACIYKIGLGFKVIECLLRAQRGQGRGVELARITFECFDINNCVKRT